MPRLSYSLLRLANRVNSNLPHLLRATRNLRDAKLELKWLQAYIHSKYSEISHPLDLTEVTKASHLRSLCLSRSRDVPLQYLLGTEFFGPLELKCRPGVLIPRQATADAVSKLLELLAKGRGMPAELNVVDLCSGTGCIGLLVAHDFPFMETAVENLCICGVDVEARAVKLGKENRAAVLEVVERDLESGLNKRKAIKNLKIIQADLFDAETLEKKITARNSDVIISNPPYISPAGFRNVTTRSVRRYEPKIALVPEVVVDMRDSEQADVFYHRILQLAHQHDTKIVLFEVGDLQQATRVASLMRRQGIWKGIEIWRDDPREIVGDDSTRVQRDGFVIIGRGEGRSVFCWRKEAHSWISRDNEG